MVREKRSSTAGQEGVRDALLAQHAADTLRTALSEARGDTKLSTDLAEPVVVPAKLLHGLVDLLDDVAADRDPVVAPGGVVLTSEQAAAILNVSRTWVTRLAEKGEIPFRWQESHRRFRLADVMARRREDIAKARAGTDALAAFDQDR